MQKNIKRKAARELFQQELSQLAGEQEFPLVPEQKTSEELQLERSIRVRETGFLWWKTVVVPPNVYVVHTRRGRKEPVTLGLGISFRYNPRTDSYLLVPAALQTIGIVVKGISKERQGINILAYVQWLISDISIAYKKLDFSDPKDPMGVVNAQLREQAEAAIKDKISTMSLEEILTDKAPIIEELTQRMKSVAEGKDEEGLGLKIVTVQIKEAFVSSQRLWSYLQEPFRNEREREARLSRLKIEEEVKQQELNNKKKIETSEAITKAEIEKFKAEKQRESYEIVTKERLKCHELDNQEKQKKIELEEKLSIRKQEADKKVKENQLKLSQEIELLKIQNQEKIKEKERESKLKELKSQQEILKEEHKIEEQKLLQKLSLKKKEKEFEIELHKKAFETYIKEQEEYNKLEDIRRKQEIEYLKQKEEIYNSLNENNVANKLINILPEIANNMPDIKELKTLQISSESNNAFSLLTNYIAKVLEISKSLGIKIPLKKEENEESKKK